MAKFNQILPRWFPALLMMFVIFFFSSQPSGKLPNLAWADSLFKKGGHVLGYGLLSLSYWHGLGWVKGKRPYAWLFSILYAATDEFHQSFVDGRNPSFWDVVIFDNLGALIALWLAGLFVVHQRPGEDS